MNLTMTMADDAWFERAMSALEQAVGATVTVVDYQGLFHTPTGALLFPRSRQSHRKLPVCNLGFSSRCVDFCRHAMNRVSRERGDAPNAAFTKQCWKGVVEIVAPLRRGKEHWGMCYLGPWRADGFRWQEVTGVPRAFGRAYEALPLWREAYLENLGPLLEAFTAGVVARLVTRNALERPIPGRKGEVMEYLYHHASSPEVSLQGLAAALHLSPSRTSRLLSELFQRTFTSLLHEIRVNRVKVLLLSGDDPLATIAAATGFSDEYHLSKVFRKVMGCPPGWFRRQQDALISPSLRNG